MKISFDNVSFKPQEPDKNKKPQPKKPLPPQIQKAVTKAKTGAIIGLFLLPTLGIVKNCSTGKDPNKIVIVDAPADTTNREKYVEVSEPSVYVVKSGDSPARIAKKHGISTRRLLAFNNMDEKSLIYPNDTLLIPESFTAKNIESLEDVAKMSGISEDYLETLIDFEKFHNKIYKDRNGNETIGIGHLVRNDAGVRDRLGKVGKERRHLVARLHVELVRLHLHAGGIVQRALGLDAHEHVLHLPVLFFEVVHVVGRNQSDVRLARELHQKRQDLLLFGNAVILDLNVKVLAERFFHLQGKRLCLFVLARKKKARNTPRKAGREADDAVRMLFEDGIVDARAVVVAVYKGKRIELDEVDVARLVFGEQDKVIGLLIDVLAVVVHDVEFAADDRLDLIFLALFGKLQGGVHVAVIGDRNRVDAVVYAMTHQIVHLDGAVQKTVLRM